MLGLLRNFAAVVAEFRTILSAPLDDGWETDGGQILAEREAETEVTEPICGAPLNVAGEHFACEMNTPHDGWGHANAEAQAIWDGPASHLTERGNHTSYNDGDRLDRIIVLLEDVRNLLQHNTSSAAFASSADDAPPGEADRPAGPPKLSRSDILSAAYAMACYGEGEQLPSQQAGLFWKELSAKFYKAAPK